MVCFFVVKKNPRACFVGKILYPRTKGLFTWRWGTQVGEVTCGRSPHISCKHDQIRLDYMDRRVTPVSGLPHLPGVPHLHVNRPYKRVGRKTVCGGAIRQVINTTPKLTFLATCQTGNGSLCPGYKSTVK